MAVVAALRGGYSPFRGRDIGLGSWNRLRFNHLSFYGYGFGLRLLFIGGSGGVVERDHIGNRSGCGNGDRSWRGRRLISTVGPHKFEWHRSVASHLKESGLEFGGHVACRGAVALEILPFKGHRHTRRTHIDHIDILAVVFPP